MQTLQNTIAAIKHFQHRSSINGQTKKEKAGDLMRSTKCVECGGHVPPYQNFLCEDCWREALKEKIEADGDDKGNHNSKRI
jgi:uncharacterized OB-fold protein